MRISFLYLRSFSKTGGIEKFNKLFMLSLQNITTRNNFIFKCISAYDTSCDKNYLNPRFFKGFDKNKIVFTLYTLIDARKRDIIILAHINLALIGVIIKLFWPQKKVFLIVHGIEVWQKQTYFKKLILYKADKILSVSEFTKSIILENYPLPSSKFSIFPNTFDPFFSWPNEFVKNQELLKKYKIDAQSKVLITVARLEFSEKYKGYDKVLESLPVLVQKFPDVIYMIVGKADGQELLRITDIIEKYNIQKYVRLIGFVPDVALIDHYLLGDIFVMPSKKEGFGIVFIEAVLCGLRVIVGNKDASREAVLDGKVGLMVNPDSVKEIEEGLDYYLTNPLSKWQKQKNISEVNHAFNIETFENRLLNVLIS